MAIPTPTDRGPSRPALRARYDGRRDEVVAVAAQLFAERGYHGTSMADLTAATGLAPGGLYHYIGSKESLLVRICDELMDPLLAEAQPIATDGAAPEDRLRRLLRTWMIHVDEHHDHMLVFQQERTLLAEGAQWRDVRHKRKTFEELLDAVLRDCEAAGLLRLGDRRLTLSALLGMVNYSPQWLRPGGRLTPEEIANGYGDLVLAG
ncbi:unannotated protein [freshwater metagenome]|uniref:Unannotated protein n=1 Tax=freshwater metagenome TaxID=449393 RepID=A0A6J7IAH8_9ZZZZ|nr:TetR family transcriptional regulator [Actinomycetota bacterium]